MTKRGGILMNCEHVGLYARDPVALADWYCATLGFTVARKLDRGEKPPVFFLTAGSGVQLEILPTERPPAKRELDGPGFTHLGLVVGDFSATEQHLRAHHVELWGVRTTSNGWRIGYFNDPEGNILEVIQR